MDRAVPTSSSSSGRSTMASPRQAAVATFFGGPVALIYFLRKNYIGIGDLDSARRTLRLGFLLLFAWNAILTLDVLLPRPASFPFELVLRVMPFVLVIVARHIAQKQVALAPRQYDFCSNWRVARSAIFCLAASVGSLLPAVIAVGTYTYYAALHEGYE
jgi:hypothetical protein